MEASFGFDFGNVRIHTGGTAEESAKAIDAHAFTVGQNVSVREKTNTRPPLSVAADC
jgi:hypothetical protein